MANSIQKITAMVLALTLCLIATVCFAQESAALFQAGTYTGIGAGLNGDITVDVTFSETEITDVVVTAQVETAGIADPALEKLPQSIIKAQSTQVDAVAGATMTSNGIVEAVNAAIVLAGADPASLMPKEMERVAKEQVSVQADIIVVGGGLTGVSAALSAAQNGASVVLVEKMSALGGASGISGGGLSAAETSLQAQYGIEYSKAEFVSDWMQAQEEGSTSESGYPDAEKVTWLVDNATETIKWLVGEGFEFSEPRAHGSGAARIHFPTEGMGNTLISFMQSKLEAANVQIIMNARATELIQDETGAVVGVKADGETADYIFEGKAVILATGGYAGNSEMVAEYTPVLAEYAMYGSTAAGLVGDGIVMAKAVGAAMYENPWVMDSYIVPVVGEMAMSVYMEDHLYMITHADGTRFVDENKDFPIVYNAAVVVPGKKYIVFDSGEAFTAFSVASDSYAEDAGVFKADTAEELAAKIGAEQLPQTIAEYGVGEDAFGKDSALTPVLGTAPYYAVEANPNFMGTFGGVKTNLNCEVLDVGGNVIAGLYAGGEMSNRAFYNQVYIGGSATQIAATTGRIAGEKAAEKVK